MTYPIIDGLSARRFLDTCQAGKYRQGVSREFHQGVQTSRTTGRIIEESSEKVNKNKFKD